MITNSKPAYVFTNKQKKKIYCWESSEDVIFSLARLDKSNGKYKSIDKKDEIAIVETATKLGLSRKQYQQVLREEVSDKAHPFYNSNNKLQQLREEKQNFINGKIDKQGNRVNNISSSMKELALLAGTVDNSGYSKSLVKEESKKEIPAPHQQSQGYFNDSVKIDKGEAQEKFFGKRFKEEEVLNEGKDDRIILGKVNVSAQANGLYKIEVENLPGEDAFHAELYTAIQKYLNNKLQTLKDSNPDVAAYENTTEGELSGKQGAEGEGGAPPEEGEVDLGFEAPPAGGEMGAGEAVAGAGAEAMPAPEPIGAPTA